MLVPIGACFSVLYLLCSVLGADVPSGLVLMAMEREGSTDYFIHLDLGSPPQRQYCKVDMGSSDSFFISGDGASTAAGGDTIVDPSEVPFNPNKSSTLFYYPATFSFESFYFNVSGVFVADDISVQTQTSYSPAQGEVTNSSTQLTNMTFGLIEDEGYLLRSCLVGLGLQGGELSINSMENGNASPVYDNLPILMKKSGLVNRVSYSVYLSQDVDNPSFILFGGVDHSRYQGNLSTVPLVDYATDASLGQQFISQPTDFQVVLSGLTVSNGAKSIDVVQDARIPINVAFGTNTSMLPTSIGSQIARIFGMVYQNATKSYWMPCDRLGDLTFNFNGALITIPLENFVETQSSVKLEDGSQGCRVLMDTQEDPIWEIGNGFFGGAYVYVDLESFEVSFAPAIYGDLEPIYEIASAGGNITNATRAPLYDDAGLNNNFNISTNNQTFYSVVAFSSATKVGAYTPAALLAFIWILLC
ncbi:Aspartic proteinase MKC7 [Wickerhamiella sorbophila]|uniref:Aspartic proteinase MKC7 n=1 Tax=Wickerhamiella sorbophila TaxID=45607 RepID=A0A2T0FI87_9ASCO|nr:Aspartic proteinase MKC7 [Wickerhamiella sorbophila]PRT54667.1 Aspartic proteinase MKC7 [Wickerhamiella sorbophila]